MLVANGNDASVDETKQSNDHVKEHNFSHPWQSVDNQRNGEGSDRTGRVEEASNRPLASWEEVGHNRQPQLHYAAGCEEANCEGQDCHQNSVSWVSPHQEDGDEGTQGVDWHQLDFLELAVDDSSEDNAAD